MRDAQTKKLDSLGSINSELTQEEIAEIEKADLVGVPELSSFPLHTHEWRFAFLHTLYWRGYPALFEGVSHAWTLMERPKAARCTYVGIVAGTGGKGKKALYNFFRAMITEALDAWRAIPNINDYPSLREWNDAVVRQQRHEKVQVDEVIEKYANLLAGRQPRTSTATIISFVKPKATKLRSCCPSSATCRQVTNRDD